MAEIKGIDISTHQGWVNWDAIQRDVNFVVIRAGYGGGGVDGQFARNWQEARTRKIPHMAYFFAYPGRSSGRAQAEEFFARVGQLQPGESIALDMEDEPAYGRGLISTDVAWAKEFLDRCKELFGVKALIYMNSNVLSRFDWNPVQDADYGLWLANYGNNSGVPGTRPAPGVWPFWALWQYTSHGNFGGISPVDMNIFSGTVEAFLKYGLAGPAPAPPQPTPAPTPPPQAPPAPNLQTTYTVQKGDTLSGIAAKFGTTYQNLARINNIADPNKIFPGQVLRVSGTNTLQPERRYIVVRGDTLGGIAAKFGTTYQALAAKNGIANPNLIFPGQVLKI